ncbi:SGNH_hydro domain-containing protein [Rhodovastum atsumiense]|uniref:Uncharacterized protein n=1 Tax=Rhodovastum atsumiense TaxID=504468 RepID=A0A5M6J126_9PROT|nr:SGNH/GDSL hydrolase family protein [Rhodovastum atsumiense]KAA5613777.1 hypothetical protein F1189_03095 [Rhodovastum atsumiense]CAH2601865.1 SGNH_hydro domain-containing protein [Rhodovastum atsumiense]
MSGPGLWLARAMVLPALLLPATPLPAVPADPASAASTACPVPDEIGLSGIVLPAARAAVRRDHRLVVLALGDGSTLGKAAQGPEYSYPARLQARLRQALPGVDVSVVTRAAPHRTAAAVVRSLDADLAGTGARLVIWNAGTVEAGLGTDPLDLADDISAGIALIRATGADLILVDPQFAPSISRIVDLAPYREAVRRSGASNDVPVLDRYELMRSWSNSGLLDLDVTEPGRRVQVARQVFDCLAAALAEAILPALTHEDTP